MTGESDGPTRHGYTLTDVPEERIRTLDYRYNCAVPKPVSTAAEDALKRRRESIQSYAGKIAAVTADLASFRARVAGHRSAMGRYLAAADGAANPRADMDAAEHERRMVQIIDRKIWHAQKLATKIMAKEDVNVDA